MKDWKAQFTIPNLLTLLRLICIPWMAGEIWLSRGVSWLSAALFMGIWFTDVLDGWIARQFNQVSALGKIFDPAVDKLFQITTAVMMCLVGRLPLWIPLAIIFKDFLLAVGALLLWRKKIVVSARWYGKVTTVLLALGFVSLFLIPEPKLYMVSWIFIVPVIMMYFSLVKYAYSVYKAWKAGKLEAVHGYTNEFEDLEEL